MKTIKFPKKQMVWGCFSWAGLGKLAFLNTADTMNQHSYLAILKQKLMPAMAHAKITRFLQDGAPPSSGEGRQGLVGAQEHGRHGLAG